MLSAPFYASGLKFTCKKCSACCRYDEGFVFLSEKDMEKLSQFLKIDKKCLINEYCRWVSNWQHNNALSLKEKNNKDCVFWDSGCTVYEARPLQCVSFPFWDSIVSNKESWKIASESCPGINRGKIYSKDEINNYLLLRKAEPVIYKNKG